MTTTTNQGGETTGLSGITNPVLKGMIAGVGQQGTPAPAEGVGVAGSTDQQIEVDVGGAKRLVPMSELRAAYVGRQEAEASKRTGEEALARAAQLRGVAELQQRIDALPAAKRAQLMQVLEGAVEEQPAEPGDFDEVFGNDDRAAPARKPDAVQAKLDMLERAVSALAGMANQDLAQKRQASLSQQVDQLLTHYPVFRANAAATSFARDSIMQQVAAAPKGTDIESIVQQAAARLEQFTRQQEVQRREETGVRLTMVTPQQRKLLTGGALKSGAVRQMAQDALRSLTQQ